MTGDVKQLAARAANIGLLTMLSMMVTVATLQQYVR